MFGVELFRFWGLGVSEVWGSWCRVLGKFRFLGLGVSELWGLGFRASLGSGVWAVSEVWQGGRALTSF